MNQSVTREDIGDILEAFGQSGFAHLELTVGSVRVVVNRAPAVVVRNVDLLPEIVQVVAPMLGTFQAGPEVDSPAFVQPGTKVQADTIVGIIRVMEKRAPVKAGLRGTVLAVLVQDGQLVEFGQTLLRISTGLADEGSHRPESNRVNAR